MKNKNTNGLFLFVCLSFIACSVLHFVVSDYDKLLSTYPDELRYYSIARSLFLDHSVEIYNLQNSYQKILYSVIIMPAFLAKSVIVRIRLIALINSILVSSGIFPVYFLAKKFLKSRTHIIICCILFLVSSDLWYSCSFLSENLFIPMGLWSFLLMSMAIRLTDESAEEAKHILSLKGCIVSVWAGAYVWCLYCCKEIAVVFLIAYFYYCAVLVLHHIFPFKQNLPKQRSDVLPFLKKICGPPASWILMTAGFMIPFFITKFTVFYGLGNSYNQQDLSVFTNKFNSFFQYYGFVYYLLMAGVAYTAFPVLISFLNRRKMSSGARHLFTFMCLLLFLSSAVIAFTITVREDNSETLPRVHLRYICYLYLPFVIMMFHSIENMGRISMKKMLLPIVIFIAWLFYYFLFSDHLITQSEVIMDQSMLSFLTYGSTLYQIIVMIIYSLATLLCAVMLLRNRKAGTIMITAFLMVLSFVNSGLFISQWVKTNKLTDEQSQERDFLLSLEEKNSDKNFLVVGSFQNSNQMIDTYMQGNNVYQVRIDDLEKLVQNGSNAGADMTWEAASDSLSCIGSDQYYSDLNKIDYIIYDQYSLMTISQDDAELVSGPMQYPAVYRLYDNEYIPDITVNLATIEQE